MGNITKALWIWSILSLMIVYVVGTTYIQDSFVAEKHSLINQATLLEIREKKIKTKKMSLDLLQESLLSELALEKDNEQKKKALLQLQKLKEEKRKSDLKELEEKRMLEQQSRVEEQRRQAEIRTKSRKKRRSRAS